MVHARTTSIGDKTVPVDALYSVVARAIEGKVARWWLPLPLHSTFASYLLESHFWLKRGGTEEEGPTKGAEMLALVKAKREIGRSRWIKASVDGTVADPDGVVFYHELRVLISISILAGLNSDLTYGVLLNTAN